MIRLALPSPTMNNTSLCVHTHFARALAGNNSPPPLLPHWLHPNFTCNSKVHIGLIHTLLVVSVQHCACSLSPYLVTVPHNPPGRSFYQVAE